uniref:Mitochondrial carrier protein n=1 Tax=Pristionchus pacificus TaxID=54126 RepID=A0A2A6BJV7_PRIPA|eukprot:PDM66200.1 mitochondrial carrier protein [Pristionchus pacificus]
MDNKGICSRLPYTSFNRFSGGSRSSVTMADQQQFSYLPKILNGGLAGIIGVTCVFPIDLVKTRLQNQRIIEGKAQYNGIADCARKTWAAGGGNSFAKFRSLYAGSSVNILLITPEKAIKLVANDFFRHQLSQPGEKKLSVLRGMAAGGLAGLCQIVITTPMELLKIQMQDAGRTAGMQSFVVAYGGVEYLNKPISVAGQPRLTATQLTMNIIKQYGFTGLYKGLSSTLARDVTFSVLYFPLFAYLDSLGPRKADGSGDAVFWVSFVSGLVSGAAACFAVTPLDVIKTRMQTINLGANDVRYKNPVDAFLKITSQEGPRALFKGAACRMMVVAPLFGIAQTVYFIGVAEYFLGVKKSAHH